MARPMDEKPLRFPTQNHYRRHRRSQQWAVVRPYFQFLYGLLLAIFLALFVGAFMVYVIKLVDVP